MKLDINFRLRAVYWVDDDTGSVGAWCPALDVYSQGPDQRQAGVALRNAVTMFLKECYRRKILDDLLVDSGFEPDGDDDIDHADQFITLRERAEHELRDYSFAEVFDVPFHLVQGHQRQGDSVPCLS